MSVSVELDQAAREPRRSRGWLWACRLSALAAAAALWVAPDLFLHFSATKTASVGAALVPATFPFALALLGLRKNPPRRGGFQIAVGTALTALIFIGGSYLRASKHVWAPPLPSALVALPQCALIFTSLKSHGPLARQGDYGMNFFARSMLAVYFSGVCFVVTLFLSGILR